MKCIQCGSANTPDAKFCRGCGNNLEEQQKASLQEQERLAQERKEQQERLAEARKKRFALWRDRLWRYKVVLGCVLLSLAVVGGYLYYQKVETDKAIALKKQQEEAEARAEAEAEEARRLAAKAHLITRKSVGSIQIGMNVAQVRELLPNMKLVVSESGDGLKLVEVRDGEDVVMLLVGDQAQPINDRTEIEEAIVCDKRYATEEGVHPGMLLRDVEGIYGKLTSISMSELESREYAGFAQRPTGITLQVEGGIYIQGKRETTQFSPNASVLCIYINKYS